jgi:hypothetical protein
MAEEDELANLRLDYDQTQQTFRLLSDIRFRLLAFVPAVSAALITFLSSSFGKEGISPAIMFTVGLLGFFVALGIIVYELRNSELYAATIHRGKLLETVLKLPPNEREYDAGGDLKVPPSPDQRPGGLFTQRDSSEARLWKVPVKHDVGLALIYGAVLGAWIFPVVLGLLTAVGKGTTWVSAAAVASVLASIAVGTLTYRELRRLDQPGQYVARLGYPPAFGARGWQK